MSTRSRTAASIVALSVAVGLAILAYGGGNVLAVFVGFLLEQSGIELAPRHLIILSVVTIQLVAFVGVSIGYLQYRERSLRDIGVEMPSLEGWLTTGAGFVGVLVLWGLAAVGTVLISNRYGIEQPQQEIIRLGQEDPVVFLLLAVLSILIVGPTEELLFRGVIQTRLRETFGVVSGLGLATFVFAVIHLPGYANGSLLSAVLGITILFLVGSILAVTYEYTGNLVVPAIIHGLFNAAQGALGYFSVRVAPEEVAGFVNLLLAFVP